MLDYQNQWKDERDAQTVWVTHEALELNLKNEKDFFQEDSQGQSLPGRVEDTSALEHSGKLTEVQLEYKGQKNREE